MFPCIQMLDFYNSIGNKYLEVVILDCDVLFARFHLWGNCDHNRTLIVFMHNDQIFKKTGFYLGKVVFKFEHKEISFLRVVNGTTTLIS